MSKNHLNHLFSLGAALLLTLPLLAQAGAGGRSLHKEISGRVTHDGKPVPGAQVVILGRELPIGGTLLAANSPTTTKRIQTDAEGQFVTQVPAWRTFSIYAEVADKDLTSPVLEEIQAPRNDLHLALGAAWNIRGKLVYRNRAPGEVMGIRLRRTTSKGDAVHLIVEGKAGEDGSFNFKGLPPGPWQLKLNGKKRRLAKPYRFMEATTSHEIQLARAYSITVRVGTASGILGKNVANPKITIIDTVQFYQTTGDENGQFVLHGIEKGPGATFLMEAAGYCKKIYALEPGLSPKDPEPQAEINADMQKPYSGRLLDEMGNPAEGMTVVFAGIIHSSGVSVSDLSVSTKTDKTGAFSSDALNPEGVFEVLAILPGGEPMKLGVIRPGTMTRDLGTFRLGTRRVHLTLQMQKDVLLTPDHEIAIYGPKESGQFHASQSLVQIEGMEFRTPSILPGEYVIVFTSKTLGIARRKVFIPGGQRAQSVVEAQLLIKRPALIEGTLVDSKGKPIADRKVQLATAGDSPDMGSSDWTNMVLHQIRDQKFPEKDYPQSVTSDANGKFKILCLEGSGLHDLLVTRKQPGDAPRGVPPLEPMRITNILGRAKPLVIRLP